MKIIYRERDGRSVRYKNHLGGHKGGVEMARRPKWVGRKNEEWQERPVQRQIKIERSRQKNRTEVHDTTSFRFDLSSPVEKRKKEGGDGGLFQFANRWWDERKCGGWEINGTDVCTFDSEREEKKKNTQYGMVIFEMAPGIGIFSIVLLVYTCVDVLLIGRTTSGDDKKL